jgi:hypothetical protein
MYWQYLNDKDGAICRTALETAGIDWKNYRFIDPSGLISRDDSSS